MKIIPLKSNQTELHLTDGTVVFFSYKTPVAGYNPQSGYFRTDEFFSTTTSRHINNWLKGEVGDAFNDVPKVSQSEIDSMDCLSN